MQIPRGNYRAIRVESKKGSEEMVKFPKGVLVALAGIIFVSGFCSLAYQVVWLREFRLIFGGAAPAASAVLAVFMGGLGLGGLILGKRVEAAVHPGRWYAGIEAAITLAHGGFLHGVMVLRG